MGSKVNPIRLRLGTRQQIKKSWYNEFLSSKTLWKDSNLSWEKGLSSLNDQVSSLQNLDNIKAYQEVLFSKKRNWSSAWSGSPTDQRYKDCFLLDLNLRRLVKASYLKIGFISYQIRTEIKKGNTDLSIYIYVYPLKKLPNYPFQKLDQIQIELTELIQRFRGLKAELLVIDSYQLLQQKRRHISIRSAQAEKKGIVRFNMNNFENQQWTFQLVNSTFLLKSAELLANHIALELPRVKKQHLLWLSFLEKSLQSFWQINSQFQTLHGISSFSQKLVGLRVQVKGRLNGQDRKQKLSFSVGCLSLQELDVFVDYSYSEAFTRYGVLGIKVWVATVQEKKRSIRNFSSSKSLASYKNRRNLNLLINEPTGW